MGFTEHKTNHASGFVGKKPDLTPFFQAKLTINDPGDEYEQEADAMADKVMRMPVNDLPFFNPVSHGISHLQRKCAHCEEEEKLQRKESFAGHVDTGHRLSAYIHSLSSKGSPMPSASKKFFEPRFGNDFSNVKIHDDPEAASTSQSINALAFTVGNHIVFNQHQFSPETDQGKTLLAHELTHVIQQKNIDPKNETVRCKKSPNARKSKTDLQLKRFAIWPDEAITNWRFLSAEDRNKVLNFMIAQYGFDFSARFLTFTKIKKPRDCVDITTNSVSESRESLEAKGYRFVGLFPGSREIWVNSNCNTLNRILPSTTSSGENQPAVEPPEKRVSPPPSQQSVITSLDDINFKNPAAGHGELIRSTQNLGSLNIKGKAAEYEDGTIIITANDGSVTVLVPVNEGEGNKYTWFGSNGVIYNDYSLDPDEIF